MSTTLLLCVRPGLRVLPEVVPGEISVVIM